MLLKEFFRHGVRHLQKLYINQDYRQWCALVGRYGRVKRYVDCVIPTPFGRLRVPDSASFLSTYKEMFVDRIYSFRATRPDPVILDMGANIGLSVIFFKQLYPRSKITAFEADPAIFEILQENMQNAHFTDVVLLNRAVWNAPGELIFASDHADGGRLIDKATSESIAIEAVDIRQILAQYPKIDFLKIDIEGAERFVLPAAAGLLENVEHIFVEFHSVIGEPQRLNDVMQTLAAAGFRLSIQSVDTPLSPLIAKYTGKTFDLQLNIFGKREKI